MASAASRASGTRFPVIGSCSSSEPRMVAVRDVAAGTRQPHPPRTVERVLEPLRSAGVVHAAGVDGVEQEVRVDERLPRLLLVEQVEDIADVGHVDLDAQVGGAVLVAS